ncbi:MAG: cobalamin B12-binding domain-containing protein [Bacillota bacterium]
MNNSQLDISNLPEISNKAADQYKENLNLMINKVNDLLNSRDDINQLISYNSLSMMHDNHENNGKFMSNIFRINDYQLFKTTLPWSYRAYHNKGFNYDYFKAEVKAWIQAVKEFIEPEIRKEIITVYQWILDNHETIIKLSKKAEDNIEEIPGKWQEIYNKYLQYLLAGEHLKADKLYQETIDNREDARNFYEFVIKNALYQVGDLWEEGKVSVAEEHMASSITSRILSNIYMSFLDNSIEKGKVVITSIANEFHEIGARIIADSLEFEGWDVKYLGADTPATDLIKLLKKEEPFVLGLSVSMSFNLENIIKVVEKIRRIPELEDLKILVGGKIFNENPGLWEKTGADAFAKNSDEAVQIVEDWWQGESKL